MNRLRDAPIVVATRYSDPSPLQLEKLKVWVDAALDAATFVLVCINRDKDSGAAQYLYEREANTDGRVICLTVPDVDWTRGMFPLNYLIQRAFVLGEGGGTFVSASVEIPPTRNRVNAMLESFCDQTVVVGARINPDHFLDYRKLEVVQGGRTWNVHKTWESRWAVARAPRNTFAAWKMEWLCKVGVPPCAYDVREPSRSGMEEFLKAAQIQVLARRVGMEPIFRLVELPEGPLVRDTRGWSDERFAADTRKRAQFSDDGDVLDRGIEHPMLFRLRNLTGLINDDDLQLKSPRIWYTGPVDLNPKTAERAKRRSTVE